jgi:hypothetical protein
MLADLHSAPTALLLILLGGVLAAALWIGMAALRRTEEPRKRSAGTGRVVVGPALRDGVWCRLVAFEDGHRRVEVLGPQGWVPSHRDVAHLLQAIPGRTSGSQPKA